MCQVYGRFLSPCLIVLAPPVFGSLSFTSWVGIKGTEHLMVKCVGVIAPQILLTDSPCRMYRHARVHSRFI